MVYDPKPMFIAVSTSTHNKGIFSKVFNPKAPHNHSKSIAEIFVHMHAEIGMKSVYQKYAQVYMAKKLWLHM